LRRCPSVYYRLCPCRRPTWDRQFHYPNGTPAPIGEIKNLTRPKLLIIDEVGSLTLETTHASLLFQAICERYEKQQAIVLTRNKAFADWSHVFAGDAIMASAALDRLLHRSTVINIRGDSYWLKEKRKTKAALEVIAEK
jgi:DNA replication protein DnaC